MMKEWMDKFNAVVIAAAVIEFFFLLFGESHFLAPWPRTVWWINLILLAIFMAAVLTDLLSTGLLAFLRSGWFLLTVPAALLHFLVAEPHSQVSVLLRLAATPAILLSRGRRSHRFVALMNLKPAHMMIVSFLAAITTGTILLQLPMASTDGCRLRLVDALFTATSATCVTGLIVRDTGGDFTLFGQLVILALIQIGALGIMTFSVSLALILRREVHMRMETVMQDVLDQETLASSISLIRFIMIMTFSIELVGAVALFLIWHGHYSSALACAYDSVFHAVSAFCNAGFSTFSDSLMRFSADISTNLVVMTLIITGGLGFVVVQDLWRWLGNRIVRRRAAPHRFRVQTRAVLAVSLLLIVLGASLIYLLERGHAFADMPAGGGVVAAVFQSVTARTAGFNTVNTAGLSRATLFLLCVWMFIGASSGSTGGGIKTTTVAVLWATMWSGLRRRDRVELWKRSIGLATVRRAVAILISSLAVVCAGVIFLLHAERFAFQKIIFEAVSAFGTVGLTTGITAQLTPAGKTALIMLMFIGRLGPLSLGYALSALGRRPAKYAYPEERVMIG